LKLHWVIVPVFLMGISCCFDRLSQGLMNHFGQELVVETANNLSWKNSRSANSPNASHHEDPGRL